MAAFCRRTLDVKPKCATGLVISIELEVALVSHMATPFVSDSADAIKQLREKFTPAIDHMMPDALACHREAIVGGLWSGSEAATHTTSTTGGVSVYGGGGCGSGGGGGDRKMWFTAFSVDAFAL